MATMTYNAYPTTYRSVYQTDYLRSRGLNRSTGDTLSSRQDFPSVHATKSKFQSPLHRESDSASSRKVISYESRPLPARPNASTHLESSTISSYRPPYSTFRSQPLKADYSDGYQKSEKNCISRSKVSQIPSVHTTTKADSPMTRTSTFGKYGSNLTTSPVIESERNGAAVRRRSASVGAAARNVADNVHKAASSVAVEEDASDNEKDKRDSLLISRTEQVSSDSTNNSNDKKPESMVSSGVHGQILGGTTSDDYRNRGNGQQPASSIDSDRSALSRRDSTSDYMVSGHRLSDKGAVGLDNLGNTCFMNSILQCLSNTRPLLEYCLSGSYVSDVNKKTSQMNGLMIKAYAQLMRSMWDSSKSSSVSPTEFKSQVSKFARQFVGYSQHDAHEFLIYLLEGLNEELNRIQEKKKRYIDCSNEVETISAAEKAKMSWQKYIECDNSKIIDIFAGQLKSALTCNECGYVSNTFDPFLVMSLPIKKKGLWSDNINLAECFDLFTQEETLSGDDRPTCAKCRCRRSCNKRFSIQRFPRILVIHLKRFNQGSSYSKLRTEVNCPSTGLDLTKYSADSLNQSVVYNLYAVSNHTGTMLSGHYTAFAKSPFSSQWYTFNDSRVTPMRPPKLNSDAYLLFYELQD